MLLALVAVLQILVLLRTVLPEHVVHEQPCPCTSTTGAATTTAGAALLFAPHDAAVVLTYPVPKPWSTKTAGWPSARWAVDGQDQKRGAGLLFFAYGDKQLHHFLSEATVAAAYANESARGVSFDSPR